MKEAYNLFLQQRLDASPRRSLLEVSDSEVEHFRTQLRESLREKVLGIGRRKPVKGLVVGEVTTEYYRRNAVVIQCEEGSWQTAQLYLPVSSSEAKFPAIVLASGHGGSKAHGYNSLAAQLYVKLGCAVLVPDPIGEEERHKPYGLGIRGHRRDYIVDRMNEAGRPFLGKVVADLQAGIEYLRQRADIDEARIGCAGSSMGGTLVQLLVAVEPGVRAAVISSWAADYRCLDGHIGCCYRLPGMIKYVNQLELMALAAPECALLVCAGGRDEITPPTGLQEMGAKLLEWWKRRGGEGRFACQIEEAGGHRPFHLTRLGLHWMARHLDLRVADNLMNGPVQTIGQLYERSGRTLEPLYDVERHHRGTKIPAWPLRLESPEELRVLTPGVLNSHGLTLDDFTLEGYLQRYGIESLDVLAAPPLGLADTVECAATRVKAALAEFAVDLGQWAEPPGEWERVDERTSCVSLGFAGCRLLVRESAAGELHRGRLRLGRGVALSREGDAVVDLVRFNDSETLLGISSLFINVELVQRAYRLLRERYGVMVRWDVECAIPRLGELVFFSITELHALRVTAKCGVEGALSGTGRAENIVPGLALKLRWFDLLLALAPRPVSIPRSYLHPEAQARLAAYPQVSFH